jgi:hypothetical protein
VRLTHRHCYTSPWKADGFSDVGLICGMPIDSTAVAMANQSIARQSAGSNDLQ